jgi:hypothetical protein
MPTLTVRFAAVLALTALGAAPLAAQVAPFSTIRRIALIPRPDDATRDTIATLGAAADGSVALVVRTFDRRNGRALGSPFVIPFAIDDAAPVDVLLSTVADPGSVLVLDRARRLHRFPLAFAADGTPRLARPGAVIGPVGPATAGEGTVLGEAPNAREPNAPLLAVGTTSGEVFLGFYDPDPDPFFDPEPDPVHVAVGPIHDLGAVRQVGHFAFAAVAGGTLHLIEPDADATTAGLQPRHGASLRDPRRIGLVDFAAPALRRDSRPFFSEEPDPIVAANGTSDIATLELPSRPATSGTLAVLRVVTTNAPVSQVTIGSLGWLAADGSGVLYNAGFTLQGGLAGRAWTVAGASLQLAPRRWRLGQGSNVLTATLECENGRAVHVAKRTLTLSVDGVRGGIAPATHETRLVDVDGDDNVELVARFGGPELAALLAASAGSRPLMRLSWAYDDGTLGTAAARLQTGGR